MKTSAILAKGSEETINLYHSKMVISDYLMNLGYRFKIHSLIDFRNVILEYAALHGLHVDLKAVPFSIIWDMHTQNLFIGILSTKEVPEQDENLILALSRERYMIKLLLQIRDRNLNYDLSSFFEFVSASSPLRLSTKHSRTRALKLYIQGEIWNAVPHPHEEKRTDQPVGDQQHHV